MLTSLTAAALALPPLTEVAPTAGELAAFPATLRAAVERLGLRGGCIHLVGASSVEAAAPWGAACGGGGAGDPCRCQLVLAGPELPAEGGAAGCVSSVNTRGGYSQAAVARTLEAMGGERRGPPVPRSVLTHAAGPHAARGVPDAFVLFNADLYMPIWRRTLAELVRSALPVVLTVYCTYEAHKVERILKWPEVEYTAAALAAGDAALVRASLRVGARGGGGGAHPGGGRRLGRAPVPGRGGRRRRCQSRGCCGVWNQIPVRTRRRATATTRTS